MKRPLLAVGASFALGIWASFFVPGSPLIWSAAFVTAGGGAALIRRNKMLLPVILLGLSAAFAYSGWWAGQNALPLARAAEAGEVVTVRGVVTEATLSLPGYTMLVDARFEDADLPDTTLRLRGYGELDFAVGDGIRCTATLAPLQGSSSYYPSRGVFVTGRIVKIEPFSALNLPEATSRGIAILRKGMLDRLADRLPEEIAAVASGMVLGDRASLDRDVADALARSGTIHLLSVSGMHLSIVIGCITRVLERLGLGKRPRALISGLAAIAFAMLTGFSASMTRALLMTLIMLLADLSTRRSDSLSSLGFALLLLGIARPHWFLSSGLWLSASSTAGIAVLYRPLWRQIRERFHAEHGVTRYLTRLFLGAGAISLSAYAFSFPVLLATSGWVPLISPLANILIAPLTTPALLCGMACAILPAAGPFPALTALFIHLILSVSQGMARLPFAFSLDELWRLVFLAALVGMGMFLWKTRAERALWKYAAVLMAIVFGVGSSMQAIAARDQVELIALDGCSPTILLRGDRAVIVGTPSLYEIGTLLRYLDFRQISGVDVVIAYDSSAQIGTGIRRLTSRYEPSLVVGPDDDYILTELAHALPGMQVVSCGYASIDVLGGVRITVSPTGEATLFIGGRKAVKSGADYVIMEGQAPPDGLRIWKDGLLVWTKQTPPAFEPVGDLLFGERRIILDCP